MSENVRVIFFGRDSLCEINEIPLPNWYFFPQAVTYKMNCHLLWITMVH